MAVFTLTDRVQHAFWKFREPAAFPEVTAAQARRFGAAIDDAYIEVDRQIGEIVSGLGEDDLLVIVSDHGFRSSGGGGASQQSGIHAREGIFILHGKQVRRGGAFRPERMPRAEILQVTPTILYLAGLPVGEDMGGGIIREAISEEFLRARPVEKIPSYDEPGGGERGETTLSPEAIEQLKSLGYVQ
jgi:predicted AlkP superfamily phosphohydrolase/phosphomutase